MHFWTFWRFSGRKWAKLALMYSERHLHDSMPFFAPAPCFTTVLLGHVQKSKFRVRRESDLHLYVFTRLSIFFLVPFLFLLFLPFCCSDWPSTGLMLPVKKFWESVIGTGKFYHEVAMCICRQFWCEFFSQTSEHFRISGST